MRMDQASHWHLLVDNVTVFRHDIYITSLRAAMMKLIVSS